MPKMCTLSYDFTVWLYEWKCYLKGKGNTIGTVKTVPTIVITSTNKLGSYFCVQQNESPLAI